MSNLFSRLMARLLVILNFVTPAQAPQPQWTDVPPEVNYITKLQFRARTMETISSDSPTFPGWTPAGEEVSAWSEWATNGSEPVASTPDCEVQSVYHAYADPPFTEYIYRTRTRTYTYCRWSAWSPWQDGLIFPAADREVQSRTLYAVDESMLPSSLHIQEMTSIPMFPGTGCQLQYLPGVSTLNWHSTNPSVVSVSGSGYLSAHRSGAARIIASSRSGAYVAAITVLVGEWEDNALPSALQVVPAECFSGAGMNYINLRDSSVVRIGDQAFADCDELRLVLAGSRPIDAAWNAFSGCDRLVIACEAGSPMRAYADSSGIPYYVIGEAEPWQMITSIDLSTHQTALRVGEGFFMQAYLQPEDASLPTLTWSSSNPAAVTVSPDGYVHAAAPGYAIVTARAQDGSAAYDNCMVTVHPADYTGISDGTDIHLP